MLAVQQVWYILDVRKQSWETSGASAVDMHALWYPTVRRTVLCLSKIYKCLDVSSRKVYCDIKMHFLQEAVFAGLSQVVLQVAVDSLQQAAQQIQPNQKRSIDRELFLVKHLLILREQTAPFYHGSGVVVKVHCLRWRHEDNSLQDTTIDVTGRLRDSARQLWSDTRRWFALSSNNALLEFFLQPPANVKEEVCVQKRAQ